jgi:hypothetical protein
MVAHRPQALSGRVALRHRFSIGGGLDRNRLPYDPTHKSKTGLRWGRNRELKQLARHRHKIQIITQGRRQIVSIMHRPHDQASAFSRRVFLHKELLGTSRPPAYAYEGPILVRTEI